MIVESAGLLMYERRNVLSVYDRFVGMYTNKMEEMRIGSIQDQGISVRLPCKRVVSRIMNEIVYESNKKNPSRAGGIFYTGKPCSCKSRRAKSAIDRAGAADRAV